MEALTRFTQRMPHFTTHKSLLAFFQCREFVMHAITQQGIRWNGGEKRCLQWAIRDPNSVDKVAEELRCVASSLRHIISAIADTERRLYEVNFHDLSENGGFTLEKCEQQCIVYIRSMVGRVKSMLMLVSGEVDFAVCAALFHEALLQVITRRECRASTSITVSCVKTNPSRSSLVYSNSELFFGHWLLISSSYQRSDLRFQMVLV
ncbi:GMP synthase-like protein [Daphnia magna]|uniref:GMP synthase-like protein n=1 Tax=Daphnia magna TaxID=35525 RepID=A0A164YVZ9_9CRUS|nr:GMP synthase-like protein [Daphnia magna]